jgi:phosphoribosylanthranilate isomerase
MPPSSLANAYRLETVKICGMTSIEDRDLAADAGADYFGVLVEVASSPRSITVQQARSLLTSPPIPGVVLLFNATEDRILAVAQRLKPFAVQLIGKESPETVASLKSRLDCEVWKTLYIPPKGRGDFDLEGLRQLAEEYEDSGADALLFGTLDTSGGATKYGGNGVTGDWTVMRALLLDRIVPGFLSGGLNPDNIGVALAAVKPAGIDLCSGVELSPGKKDPQKLSRLMAALQQYRSPK